MPAVTPSKVTVGYLLVVIGSWCGFICRLIFFSPSRRLERALSRYGQTDRVMGEIDRELRETPVVWLCPQQPRWSSTFIALTPNWLIQVRSAGAEVIKLDELVWIYKRAPRHRVWVWSTRERARLGCRLRYRNDYYLEGRARDLDELAEELLEMRPGLLSGWQSEYVDLLGRGPAALWAAYEKRATEFARLSPDERDAWLDENCARFDAAVLNLE
jgi:hypothetical protein